MASNEYQNIVRNLQPMEWNRQRPAADGEWITKNLLQPTHKKDEQLAKGLDNTIDRVSTFESKINTLTNTVSGAVQTVNSMATTVNGHTTDIEKINTDLDTINDNMEILSAGYVGIGNSVSALNDKFEYEIEHETSAKLEKVYVNEQLKGDGTHNNPIGIETSHFPSPSALYGLKKNGQWAEIINGGGGGGGTSDLCWYPEIDEYGLIHWQQSTSTVEPTPTRVVGEDGVTPHINSTNKHWYIGETDTGIVAEGKDGKDGTNGTNGTNGADGADACPISAKSTEITNGHNVKIFYTSAANPDTNSLADFNVLDGQDGSDIKFDTGTNATMSGTGASDDPYGVNTDVLATHTWVENQHYIANVNITAFSGDGTSQSPLDLKIDNPDSNKKYGYKPGTGWTEISEGGTDYDIVGNNGVSAKKDTTNNQYIVGLSGDYVKKSGDTMTGPLIVSAANGQNLLAVASAATLIGASRQTSANFGQNDNAMGTTWMGVCDPGMYRGFFKYTQGGAVGALDSQNMMQIEFTPSNKGQIFAKATNNGTAQPETQILNPVKSTVDSMATSANVNLVSGPNYMLAKNADGQFVIGAACINCTAMNDVTLSANTYYFVYEV